MSRESIVAHGWIVLENVPESAVVEVDGDRVTVTPKQGEPLKIEAQPGKHGVIVKRGGDVLLGESVTIESGHSFQLTVRHEPVVTPRPDQKGGTVVATAGTSRADVELARRNQAILAKLEEPMPMRFPNETPLDGVLKYIQETAKKEPNGMYLPIYVNPIGLLEAERSLNSTIQIDLKDASLKSSLSLLLKQLGLAYYVKDGVLIITDEDSIGEMFPAARAQSPAPAGAAGASGAAATQPPVPPAAERAGAEPARPQAKDAA